MERAQEALAQVERLSEALRDMALFREAGVCWGCGSMQMHADGDMVHADVCLFNLVTIRIHADDGTTPLSFAVLGSPSAAASDEGQECAAAYCLQTGNVSKIACGWA